MKEAGSGGSASGALRHDDAIESVEKLTRPTGPWPAQLLTPAQVGELLCAQAVDDRLEDGGGGGWVVTEIG